MVEDFNHIEYFYKSRQGKDENGNNSLHYAFLIKDETLRVKVLDLLLDEKVGDPGKRNLLGYLPEEMMHCFNIDEIPWMYHN